ncbi:MAG TPA: DNA recombination/repair protein RecA, partial [Hyphomonas sp.]|nr:DNA recombination/repair protein RecA [Hyphomonas sp.]
MAKAALQLVDKESGVDKQKALETALGNIERSFGKGSVMR